MIDWQADRSTISFVSALTFSGRFVWLQVPDLKGYTGFVRRLVPSRKPTKNAR
jgi:hypothetical protein